MLVYLAASSRERERARHWLDALSAHPHLRLAHDWLAHIEAEHRPDHAIPLAEQLDYALGDLSGIERCDVVWLLAPMTVTKGAWFECGFAYGLKRANGTPGWLVSGDAASCIFASLADQLVRSDGEAFALLERMSGRLAL